MNVRRQQTFVSEEEAEGEEFDGAPGDPPDDGGQRGLPLRHRADRHGDAEAHDPHEPESCLTMERFAMRFQFSSDILST